ncbi:ATP-binding protein [Ferrovum myxofaciens]|uniref:ATP-binding protein n=1 Tax=Ferrovum myxofaciens TaxID=416213 RepID=UPI0023542E87|nr:ATP-binding protein [Ferrovum myxofaciens]MBU6995377.1 ATP-binding protein [Ferrovum myxofaciens]
MELTESLRQRAERLHLHGLLSHWNELSDSLWVEPLLSWEESERAQRSLERRLSSAHIGRFRPLADFDWNWPEQCDQIAISELMTLEFLQKCRQCHSGGGPAAWGNPPSPRTLPIRLSFRGHTVLFTTAGQLLGDLAALDSDSALRRRLRHYASPQLVGH